MYIIDRFEGNYVILEDENKQMHQVEREKVPLDAKEGDCIKSEQEGYALDLDASRLRRERIKKLMNDLFE